MMPEKPAIRRKQAKLRGRRASVSVEFALVSLFFLFPLIAGGIDMLLVLSARSKLNSALHAIYLFAWSDPQNAADPVQLQRFIQSIDPALPRSMITLNNTPALSSVCLDSNGNVDGNATFTTSVIAAVTGIGGSGTNSNSCLIRGTVAAGDVPVVMASYSLSSVVQLPIPVPFLANPITLTTSGTIQIE